MRLSGEPYLTHTIAVATIVAELGLDETSVAAALLHDVVEDTPVSIGEIESSFGTVIAQIVDGVTKLDRLNFSTKEAQQAATIRKMVIAMSKDWRVLVIKLADRLHNMRTIDVMPEWKQRRTAQQTLDVYAPSRTVSASSRSSGNSKTFPSGPCSRRSTTRSRKWWRRARPAANRRSRKSLSR